LEAVLAAADMALANIVRLNFYTADVDELFKHFTRVRGPRLVTLPGVRG
jgi:enamine deaminase RidA (YjgF/YER057c/UK114 family)